MPDSWVLSKIINVRLEGW